MFALNVEKILNKRWTLVACYYKSGHNSKVVFLCYLSILFHIWNGVFPSYSKHALNSFKHHLMSIRMCKMDFIQFRPNLRFLRHLRNLQLFTDLNHCKPQKRSPTLTVFPNALMPVHSLHQKTYFFQSVNFQWRQDIYFAEVIILKSNYLLGVENTDPQAPWGHFEAVRAENPHNKLTSQGTYFPHYQWENDKLV